MCIPSKKENEIKPKKHLREERQKIMDSMQLKHEKMLSLIDSWNGIGSVDVKKKDMKEMPDQVWIQLSPRVRIRRLDDLGGLVCFDTEMKKGGEFGLHLHSDCREICEVVKGEIVDLVTNECFTTGEKLIVEKGEQHFPIALEDTVLKVYFE